MATGLFDDIVGAQPSQKTGLFDDIVAERDPNSQAVGPLGRLMRSDVVGQLAYGATPRGLNESVGKLFHGVGQGVSYGLNKLVGQEMYQAGRPILPIPAAHDPTTAPIDAGILQTLEGFTTPEGMVTLPLAAGRTLLNKIVQGLFASQMAQGAGESFAVAADPAAPSRQRMLEGTKGVLAGGMGLGLAKSIGTPKPIVPSGLREGDFRTSFRAEDLPQAGEAVPVSRQLAPPAPVTRFATDPLGQTIDISQLSPREFTELMRGPKEYVPREQVVRPAQAPPVVIGEQAQPTPEIRLFRPAPQIEQPVVPNKPPVEPSGGEISFRSPAAAEAIPSAGQTAQTQPYASTIRSTQEQVSKVGDVGEGRTKEGGDYLQRAGQEGAQAQPSTVQEAPREVRGMQTRAAQERASKARRETGAVFPEGTETRPKGPFALSGPRIARTPKDVGFTDTSKQVDAQQLYNRLKNRVPPKEWEFYKDVLPQSGKISPDDAAKMMEDAGPKVEVKVYGQQGRNSESQQRMGRLLHELDSLQMRVRTDPVTGELVYSEGNNAGRVVPRDAQSEAAWRIADELDQLRSTVAHESSVQPTSAYDTVSPKSTAEFPVERVDVVLPQKTLKGHEGQTAVGFPQGSEAGRLKEKAMWEPDMLHEQYPNTLGWAAKQTHKGSDVTYLEGPNKGKTIPADELVENVFEVQSRWGQEMRELAAKDKEAVAKGERSARTEPRKQDHPLLADHQRLTLKATIEEAKKKGVRKIVLSDAETAMMSEGHDQVVFNTAIGPRIIRRQVAEAEAKALTEDTGREHYVERTEDGQFQVHRKSGEPSQAPGMRLNYDSILPKIMEELTGVKGERVELGEHKNAYDKGNIEALEGRNARPRENLIFRNPDGTPKTTVSGLVYDLSKVPEQLPSLFEKDKPAERSTRMYMAPFHVFDPDFWRSSAKGVVGGVQKLGDYAKEKADATTPQGIGRIPGLSRLFDPRAYRKTEADKALLAHNAQVNKGTQMTALWLESRKGVARAFKTDDSGQVELADGSKGYMEDVIRRELRTPGSQPLTPLQKQFVDWWKKQWSQLSAELTKEGVKFFKDEDGNRVKVGGEYFPRPAIGKKNVERVVPEQQKRVIGSKQFFQHKRRYPSEEMGAKDGIQYEPDEYNRVGRLLNAAYRAIADVRLAKDPALGGKSGKPTFMEEGLVYHPAFRGKVFEAETAEKLNNYYAEKLPNWLKAVGNVNDFSKAFQFTMDVSAPFNQGLPLMGVNPVRWTKATLKSYQALFDKNVLSKYLGDKENLAAAQSIVQNGGSLAHLYDFLQGAGKGKLAAKVPIIRASARSMGTFLSIAKVELYKAFEPMVKEKGWSKAELVEAVENAVLSGKMESIGLSPGRALGERLLFNAPSYIRGAANLIAMAGQGKISGVVARRALGGMATAITLQMVALYLNSGMSGEEIEKRLNPKNTEFLRYPYDLPNGDRVEISYGNILMSIVRVLGDTVEVAQGEKEVKPGLGNPWLRFARYRFSPVASAALQILSGQDYRGEEAGAVKTLAKGMTPISLDPISDKSTSKQQKALEVGATALGLSAYPESYGNKRGRLQEQEAQKLGRKFSELSFPERRKVEKAITPALERNRLEPSTRQIASTQEATAKRGEKIQSKLSKENQELLTSAGLKIAGYEVTRQQAGATIRLTKEESEQLGELYAKELDRRLSNLRASGRAMTKDRLELVSKASRDKAWGEIRRQARGGKATVVAE